MTLWQLFLPLPSPWHFPSRPVWAHCVQLQCSVLLMTFSICPSVTISRCCHYSNQCLHPHASLGSHTARKSWGPQMINMVPQKWHLITSHFPWAPHTEGNVGHLFLLVPIWPFWGCLFCCQFLLSSKAACSYRTRPWGDAMGWRQWSCPRRGREGLSEHLQRSGLFLDVSHIHTILFYCMNSGIPQLGSGLTL